MASPKNIVQEPKMSVLKSKDISKPALSNYYQVYIGAIKKPVSDYISKTYGVSSKWISEQGGLLCADATLPTSSFATSEVKDNFHGINEQYAHTRLYIDTDFTFYVDKNYQMIKFFEGWMDYISGNNNKQVSQNQPNYFRRFNYPLGDKGYKTDTIYITKFERDSVKTKSPMLTYRFYNVFPKSMSAIPVSYGPADLLKVTVTFAYDRYIVEQGRGSGTGISSPVGDNPITLPSKNQEQNPENPSWRYTKEYLEEVRIEARNATTERLNASGNTTVRGPRER